MNVTSERHHVTVPTNGRPHVVLDAAHYGRLHHIAMASRQRAPAEAALLLREVERAELRAREHMPETVVTIGSQVTFRYNDNGQSQSVVLVFPHDADFAKRRVSVLTPIGATLIGLSQGDEMRWTTRYGEVRSLTVLKVRQPPDHSPKQA
jgi:regulator of nucleoside diphosphate kinase